ncbi:cupin domain-containing protein [Asaia astilbis]|uniref:cupin domain-containing protein n=1 Tax=Asaia astilbis TaxID=610244 RepID=UPI000472B585|nr:cupin domain-containing protein [Asaia astilbis]
MSEAKSDTLRAGLDFHTKQYVNKRFDWNAFPSNAGFPDLERAQMRFIGSGGSPKAGESDTLAPDHFTLSLVYKHPGKYAACHAHEIEEAFLVLQGVLTVGWEEKNHVVEVNLGPKDLILNAREIPHGFRNAGVEPVLMSIMVGVGKPLPPRYAYHPKEVGDELAQSFGALPGQVLPVSAKGDHPLQRFMALHVVRYDETPTHWTKAGFGRKIYVGEGGAPPSTARKEMFLIPPGTGVAPYTRDCEEAWLVIEGHITVGWEEDGKRVERQIGPRDVILSPAGRAHYFRNDELAPVTLFSAIGTPHPVDPDFQPYTPA